MKAALFFFSPPHWGTGSPPFCILLRVPKRGGGNRAGHVIHSKTSWNSKLCDLKTKKIICCNIKTISSESIRLEPWIKVYVYLVKINDLTLFHTKLSYYLSNFGHFFGPFIYLSYKVSKVFMIKSVIMWKVPILFLLPFVNGTIGERALAAVLSSSRCSVTWPENLPFLLFFFRSAPQPEKGRHIRTAEHKQIYSIFHLLTQSNKELFCGDL